MSLTQYMPLLAGILGVFMIYISYLVVRGRDLVYSSAALAVLGLFNAMMISILGYYLVALFLVVVYVGAAVMFIIITVSMIGGKEESPRLEHQGFFAGAAVLVAGILLVSSLAAYMGYAKPPHVSIRSVSDSILRNYVGVIVLLFIALAATLVEAIAIAVPRGEER